jgi:ATP-binding cassette subfamily B protein
MSAQASAETGPRPTDTRRLIPTWPFVWQMIRYAPGLFVLQSIAQMFYLGVRVLPGLIEKAFFDAITGAAPVGVGGYGVTGGVTGMVVPAVATLIALYVSVGLARMVATYGETWAGYTFRLVTGAKLRHNLMAARLRQPGAAAPPLPAGEALNRYGDDVAEVCDFPLWLPDVAGNLISFVIAVAIMASINWVITLFVFFPVSIAFVVGRLAWERYLAYGHAAGRAEDAVAGFLGEIFAAVQAIKVAGAEQSVTTKFAALGEQRSAAVVRLHMLENFLGAIYQLAVTAGIGVMLLLAGQAMIAGSFTVGDFALFTYYLWFTADLPGYLGAFVGDVKQQEVAIERLVELIPDEDPQALIADDTGRRPRAGVRAEPEASGRSDEAVQTTLGRAAGEVLELLEVRGLTSLFRGSGQGIHDAGFVLTGGSFTVVTGQVGAGKTTLLRALLGLLPRDGGEVMWNGREVHDLAAWFRPPHCAYTPQAPRLFSTTLRENILLGLSDGDVRVQQAVWQAVLAPDVAQLERGLDTLVGPRGVRLSGGQVQRAAAARMLVRTPYLLVCDDLSSALDVETERLLWERVTATRVDGIKPTLLVVSHRRPVLQRADQIVVLRQGHIESVGALPDLLSSSAEMRRLWLGADDTFNHSVSTEKDHA